MKFFNQLAMRSSNSTQASRLNPKVLAGVAVLLTASAGAVASVGFADSAEHHQLANLSETSIAFAHVDAALLAPEKLSERDKDVMEKVKTLEVGLIAYLPNGLMKDEDSAKLIAAQVADHEFARQMMRDQIEAFRLTASTEVDSVRDSLNKELAAHVRRLDEESQKYRATLQEDRDKFERQMSEHFEHFTRNQNDLMQTYKREMRREYAELIAQSPEVSEDARDALTERFERFVQEQSEKRQVFSDIENTQRKAFEDHQSADLSSFAAHQAQSVSDMREQVEAEIRSYEDFQNHQVHVYTQALEEGFEERMEKLTQAVADLETIRGL